ncbi:amidohydrolase family protein, partial [Streptomyces asiaticus]
MIIDKVRIFDGTAMLGPGAVEFADGVITRVLTEPIAAPGASTSADVIDGTGLTLLPGLIDAHTHVFGAESNLELALAFGVTTELDMFMGPPELTQVFELIAGKRRLRG